MSAYLEVWKGAGPELVPLERERCTIGKAPENDVPIPEDGTVSRFHAVLQSYAAGWSITDVGSSNGTWVNGDRIWGERRLKPGDEIRAGRTRLVFRSTSDSGLTVTETAEAPPVVTRREREVLITLCRPLLSVDVFTEPATNRDIATQLVVTEAAVRQHMVNLYDKFGIYEDEPERRRVRLANEAIRRGAVTVSDLKGEEPG
jgi:pSer/pThr/pTyr-binding forkhead associated (FHA) protein